MTPREVELLHRWSTEGDARAFDTLVSSYSGLVFSACKRILGNDADAQEATQECFFQLAHKKPQIRTSLGGWLHTVATRKAISQVRSESRRRDRERAYLESSDTAIEADWDDVQEYVDAAIRALPEDLRVPVVASFLERKTHDVIAEEMGVNRSTVTRRVERGIEGIRDFLKEKGVIATSASLGTMLSTKMTEAMPVGLVAALARIALAGGKLTTVGTVAGGGFLAGLLNLFGGTAVGKAAAGLIALGALLGGLWYVGSGFDTPEEATTQIAETSTIIEETVQEDPEVAESTSPDAGSVAFVLEPDEEKEKKDEERTTTMVEGRVYNATNNVGLEGVVVSAILNDGGRAVVASVHTGPQGRYTLHELGEGAYQLVVSEMEGYLRATGGGATKRLEIFAPLEESVEIDFGLIRGAVMTGLALHGDEPIRNAEIVVMSYSGSNSLGSHTTQTDSEGRYRLEGLSEFEGSIIPMRTQDNGHGQNGLSVMVEIRYDEESEVDLEFVKGTGAIEGTVFYGNKETPIKASIRVYFGWDEGDGYSEEIIHSSTDEAGYFFIENLPGGQAEMHIKPSNLENVERIVGIPLTEGEHVVRDIVISAFSLEYKIANVPSGTEDFFVIALPEDMDLEVTDTASFMTVRDAMLAVSRHSPGGASTLSGELKGIGPGRYIISAYAWPVHYSLGNVKAYGPEKFWRDLSSVSTFLTVEEIDETLEISLDFDAP